MSTTRRVNHALFLAVIVVGLVVPGRAMHLLAAEVTPLRILLTNDDGYDTPGIKSVREFLVAAGHDVTVVAPLRNQSGSGIRVTTQGTLDYKEQSTGVWSVDGSPADSVLVGLFHIMADQAPDMVVSGANFGPNLGYAGSSGTVGAATMAMYAGLPAIAISVGIDPSERDARPIPFPSTFRAFAGAAETTVRLISDLQEARIDHGNLLPERTILSVNYPAAKPEDIAGILVLPATWDSGVRINYEETGETGQLQIRLQLIDPDTAADDNADWHSFARGYVTVSILDGDSDAGESMREAISQRLPMIRQQ
ncbi:MAG: 5'/3'-nucleotidase SurE [Gammaproteobacteria bacterium]|nr:5'/3'-nucleotidase SurE [Gammaproteobacteria bacterium]